MSCQYVGSLPWAEQRFTTESTENTERRMCRSFMIRSKPHWIDCLQDHPHERPDRGQHHGDDRADLARHRHAPGPNVHAGAGHLVEIAFRHVQGDAADDPASEGAAPYEQGHQAERQDEDAAVSFLVPDAVFVLLVFIAAATPAARALFFLVVIARPAAGAVVIVLGVITRAATFRPARMTLDFVACQGNTRRLIGLNAEHFLRFGLDQLLRRPGRFERDAAVWTFHALADNAVGNAQLAATGGTLDGKRHGRMRAPGGGYSEPPSGGFPR